MQGLDVGGTDIPRAELQHPQSFLRICNAFAAEHEHSEADARGHFAICSSSCGVTSTRQAVLAGGMAN